MSEIIRRPGRKIGKEKRRVARAIIENYMRTAPTDLLPRDVVVSMYVMLGDSGIKLRKEIEGGK